MDSLSIYTSTTFTLIIAVLHALLSRVALQFNEVFDGFGAELPWLTKLMLSGSIYYWLMPMLFGLCFVVHHLGYINRAMVLFITSVGTIASMGLSVVGLYLPIFQLGAVVAG
jgi:type II secretory pathway component PulF